MGHKVIEARAVIATEFADKADDIAAAIQHDLSEWSTYFVQLGVGVVEEVE